jgi:hypothetical protein
MEGLESPRTYKRDDNMFNTHGDSGILGIIEKLICTQANYFLGLQGHCAKHSSYTRDIVSMRDDLQKESEVEWPVDVGKLKREYIEGESKGNKRTLETTGNATSAANATKEATHDTDEDAEITEDNAKGGEEDEQDAQDEKPASDRDDRKADDDAEGEREANDATEGSAARRDPEDGREEGDADGEADDASENEDADGDT